MPAGVGPVTVAKDEYLVDPSGTDGALSVFFDFQDVLAPDDRDVAEVLDFGPREF